MKQSHCLDENVLISEREECDVDHVLSGRRLTLLPKVTKAQSTGQVWRFRSPRLFTRSSIARDIPRRKKPSKQPIYKDKQNLKNSTMPPARRKNAPDGTQPTPKRRKIVLGASLKMEEVTSMGTMGDTTEMPLKDRFLALFAQPEYASGISNTALKQHFGDAEYRDLVPIINELNQQSKLNMSKSVGSKELFYSLLSDDLASKFSGLDAAARMVYQTIEKAGNMGSWTKEIRVQTNIQQNMLTKILKALETRRLIKQVKSVAAKSKKIYMVYDVVPSKQLSGGVWYSDLEFDHEFISKMRSFLLYSIRRINDGKGVTMTELHGLMTQKKVANVDLSLDEVRQLLQTLVFDYLVEEVPPDSFSGVENTDEPRFIAARRVSVPCEFQWWDVLETDFGFRAVQFEDGVTLAPHEPHYHTS